MQPDTLTVEWLVEAIQRLPADEPVPGRTPGYNVYRTQKDHWLGWLQPSNGTGTYPRRSGNERGARPRVWADRGAVDAVLAGIGGGRSR